MVDSTFTVCSGPPSSTFILDGDIWIQIEAYIYTGREILCRNKQGVELHNVKHIEKEHKINIR